MLTLEDVSVSYGETPVVRDVDLAVDHGEIVGVMGKNGVGKTTLTKAIIGLLPITEGRITFDGEVVADATGDGEASASGASARSSGPFSGVSDRIGRVLGVAGAETTMTSADVRARRGMGYIPQGRDVFPELTVSQNLEMGEGINEGSDRLQYETVYDYFPILEERSDQEAGTLSGGQQQMLAIGRALIGDPDLLLLDEPSEGIQPSIVQDVTRDLRELSEELGTTILFVEQNLHVIQNLADRCYAIDKGTIVDELDGERLGSRDAVAEYLAV